MFTFFSFHRVIRYDIVMYREHPEIEGGPCTSMENPKDALWTKSGLNNHGPSDSKICPLEVGSCP